MANLDSIQVHQSVTSAVGPDGSPAKEIERTEPRWTCTDSRCHLGFADWEDVISHVETYHRGPDSAAPAFEQPQAPSPQPQAEEALAVAEDSAE